MVETSTKHWTVLSYLKSNDVIISRIKLPFGLQLYEYWNKENGLKNMRQLFGNNDNFISHVKISSLAR